MRAVRPARALLAGTMFLAGLVGCATGGDGGYLVPDATREDGGGSDGTDTAGCPPGQLRCDGVCVDPLSHPQHCGGCGFACPAGQLCSAGVCVTSCPPPLVACGGSCVDPQTNADHCGSCGHACPGAVNADGACEGGACVTRCRPGWADVDGLPGCEYECDFGSSTESCNGADDDCDGAIDESFACAIGEPVSCTTSCGSTGTGNCTITCEPPNGPGCTPPVETCDGTDQDCDTVCDNGFGCCRGQVGACTTSLGAPGSRTCGSDCTWGACTASGEACNGTDDDGDGLCDEDFECCLGSTGACSTTCSTTGTRSCSTTCSWGTCSPPPETCNGTDDNCNGLCDDGVGECCRGASGPCSTSCGTTGTRSCSASCTWGICTPPAEICNGTDDNCNGVCDEGYPCCARASLACTTSCGTPGTQLCSDACTAGSCCAAAETCGNGCDDNCNGSIDEGCSTGNDACGSATALTLAAGRTTVTGTTAGATSDESCGSSAPDVWYRFTLTQTEVVSLNTYGSAYDTRLAIRAGSCAAASTNCIDDSCGTLQSEIVATLAPGTYYVAVDGFSTASGAFTLNIEHVPAGNDGLARLLAAGSSTVTGTTSGTGVVDGSCRSGSAPEHLYYWTQCPSSAGGSFTATTCGGVTWDSTIYLRSGATGTDLACNDDSPDCGYPASSITAAIPSGFGLFGYYVDGFSSYSGAYTSSVTRP
ncbi:MAG: hypothetical protein GYA57_17605 [Myxococcales bacterium]|nr:hypothetical protein [Myxococcales bacterium]